MSASRQSAWMLFATALASSLALTVHAVAPWMSKSEYGLFGTLLQVSAIMMIPSMGLQTIVTHNAAAADARSFPSMARTVKELLVGSAVVWFAASVLLFLARDTLVSELRIENGFALWITLSTGLPQLWLPILMGVLQGLENFRWLGLTQVVNSIARVVSAFVLVVLLGWQATGAIAGVLLGMCAGTAVAAWNCKPIWSARGGASNWRAWMRPAIPITMGLGTCQVMLTVDMIFARSTLGPAESGEYAAAALPARALVLLAGALVAVMYPKVVRARQPAERVRVIRRTFVATALTVSSLALVATIAATAVRAFVGLRPGGNGLIGAVAPYADTVDAVARLLPPLVWAMVPLALAIVPVAGLIGLSYPRAVGVLVVVPAVYLLALYGFGNSSDRLIGLVGLFNGLLLAAASMLLWAVSRAGRNLDEAASGG